MSVGREVASGAKPFQEIEENGSMAPARLQDDHLRLRQPSPDFSTSGCNGQRLSKDGALGGQPDEPQHDGPTQPHRPGAAQGRLPPPSRRLVKRGAAVVSVKDDVEVWQDHPRCFRANSSAWSSSSRWFILSGSIPGWSPSTKARILNCGGFTGFSLIPRPILNASLTVAFSPLPLLRTARSSRSATSGSRVRVVRMKTS